MPRLFARHPAASQAHYQELKRLASGQPGVLPGTPGTLKQRTRRGTQYWVREHIRVDGRKDDEHIGTAAAVDAARLASVRDAIELARELASGSARLRLLGYQRIERKAAAVLGALFNRGLFEAGVVLVGSHAYGALLNDLGIAAAGYRTQDIDLARGKRLSLALPAGSGLREVLEESGLRFVPVPGMPSRRPSASYKTPGGESLAVDLLVPGRVAGEVREVQELRTHAQTVPLLEFLLEDAWSSVVLSPNQVVPVRIPSAERFALHKMYASQRRGSAREKSAKDLEQALVIAVALEQETPGTLEPALVHLPAGARTAVKNAATALLGIARDVPAEGIELLRRIASR